MIIQAFNIDMSNKARNSVSRKYEVVGEPGALFHMIVQNSSGHYYNFPENTNVDVSAGVFEPQSAFSATPSNLFNQEIPGTGVYNGSITFPFDNFDNSYIITITAGNETTFDLNVFSNEKMFISDKINAYSVTGVTFSITHSNEAVVEPPAFSFKGKSSQVDRSNVNTSAAINWPFTLSEGSAHIIRQPIIDDFEFTTTKTTRNASTTYGEDLYIELTDITGLSVGMTVVAIDDVAESVITEITSGYRDYSNSSSTNFIYNTPIVINDDGDGIALSKGGTIKISNSSAWGAGQVISFIGRGSSASNIFNKTRFKVKNFKIELDDVVTTTTDSITDTVIHTASADGIKAQSQFTTNGVRYQQNFITVSEAVTSLGIGQRLQAFSSGTLVGTPTITAIDTATKTITLSSKQSVGNNVTITFSNSIAKGIGLKNATTDPYVVSVSTNDVTVNANQDIENGATVTFIGSSRSGKISGEIELLEYGDDTITLDFNFDNILNVS